MKTPLYFRLPYDSITNAKQEKLDDSHIKYILDDGIYIIASKTRDWYSSFDRYTKYEKDASQKVYDRHFDLIKIINADGTVLAELEYSHGPYPEAIRDYHSIYDTVNKKRYYVDGHYDNSYFIKDAYFCFV